VREFRKTSLAKDEETRVYKICQKVAAIKIASVCEKRLFCLKGEET